jgi:hypothetical protein
MRSRAAFAAATQAQKLARTFVAGAPAGKSL